MAPANVLDRIGFPNRSDRLHSHQSVSYPMGYETPRLRDISTSCDHGSVEEVHKAPGRVVRSEPSGVIGGQINPPERIAANDRLGRKSRGVLAGANCQAHCWQLIATCWRTSSLLALEAAVRWPKHVSQPYAYDTPHDESSTNCLLLTMGVATVRPGAVPGIGRRRDRAAASRR